MSDEKADRLKEEKENIRNAEPYSLHPYSPEAALRKIMSAKPPQGPAKPAKKKRS
jgi:hypothetical protein